MLEVALGGWVITGLIGSLLWNWAERDWRTFGYAPMWWRVIYPVMLGPIGFALGAILAISRLRNPST